MAREYMIQQITKLFGLMMIVALIFGAGFGTLAGGTALHQPATGTRNPGFNITANASTTGDDTVMPLGVLENVTIHLAVVSGAVEEEWAKNITLEVPSGVELNESSIEDPVSSEGNWTHLVNGAYIVWQFNHTAGDGDEMMLDTYGGGYLNFSASATTAGEHNWFIEVENDFGNMTNATVTTTTPGEVEAADWTVMVYLDGDNDLEAEAIDDINEMEAVDGAETVNIVAIVDRWDGYAYGWYDAGNDTVSNGNWTDARYYEMAHDNDTTNITTEPVETLGEVNMGDPQTLVDFANWSMTNYPADRYALILWDHGAGWPGVCYDESADGDGVDLAELESALNETKTLNGNENLDLIGFDACLMGMVEVMAACSDYADYFVASEETEPGCGWDYTGFLEELASDPTMHPSLLAEQIASTYIESFGGGDPSITLAAINLTVTEPLYLAVVNLAEYLNSTLNQSNAESIMRARYNTESYGGDTESVDLYHLCEMLDTYVDLDDLSTLVGNVTGAIADSVLWYDSGADYPNSHGIAIYFPEHGNYTDHLGNNGVYTVDYENTSFAQQTPWDELLRGLYSYVENDQPYFTNFSLDPHAWDIILTAGETTEVWANATDPEGGPVFYRWYINGSMVTNETPGVVIENNTLWYTPETVPMDTITIELEAADELGYTASAVWWAYGYEEEVPDENYTVSGQVEDDQGAIFNSTAFEYGFELLNETGMWIEVDVHYNETTGNFSFSVAPGNYTLLFEFEEYLPYHHPLQIVDDNITGLEVALAYEFGSVNGTITAPDANLSEDNFYDKVVFTDDSGAEFGYDLLNFNDGWYHLQITVGSYNMTVNLTGYEEQIAEVTVESRETVTRDFEFGAVTMNGTVIGNVTDSNTGAPIAGVNITLNNSGYSETVMSDENGNFTFEEVPPGEYDIEAEKVGYIPVGWSVIVTAGNTSVENFQLIAYTGPEPMLAGFVSKSDGGAAVNASVAIAGVGNVSTNASGYYEMGMDAGTYNVTIHLAGYEPYTTEVELVAHKLTALNVTLTKSVAPLEVVAYTPTATTDVPVDTSEHPITVKFNKALNESTITKDTVVFSDYPDHYNLVYDETNLTLLIEYAWVQLQHNTTYRVNITQGLKATDGSTLAEAFSFSFTTTATAPVDFQLIGSFQDPDGTALVGVTLTVTLDGTDYTATSDQNGMANLTGFSGGAAGTEVTVKLEKDDYQDKEFTKVLDSGWLIQLTAAELTLTPIQETFNLVLGPFVDEDDTILDGVKVIITVEGTTRTQYSDGEGKVWFMDLPADWKGKEVSIEISKSGYKSTTVDRSIDQDGNVSLSSDTLMLEPEAGKDEDEDEDEGFPMLYIVIIVIVIVVVILLVALLSRKKGAAPLPPVEEPVAPEPEEEWEEEEGLEEEVELPEVTEEPEIEVEEEEDLADELEIEGLGDIMEGEEASELPEELEKGDAGEELAELPEELEIEEDEGLTTDEAEFDELEDEFPVEERDDLFGEEEEGVEFDEGEMEFDEFELEFD